MTTDLILRGCTFKEYATCCARYTGMTDELHQDELLDSEIPESFTAGTFHKEQALRYELELIAYVSMTPEMIESEIETLYNRAVAEREVRIAESLKHRKLYDAMKLEVESYVPPSEDHNGLKTFMLNEITERIEWDAKPFNYRPIPKTTPEEWIEDRIEKTRKTLKYHREAQIREEANTIKRNEWLRLLRVSLK